MKKIIFIVIILLTSSCGVATSLVGDITAYTLNGDVLGKWENVTIEQNYNSVTTSSFKTFGVNFFDTKSGKYIILSNATPYIVEYKENIQKALNPTMNERQLIKKNLIDEYKILNIKKEQIKNDLKLVQKGSVEYKNIKNAYLSVVDRMNKIEYILQTNYFYDVQLDIDIAR